MEAFKGFCQKYRREPETKQNRFAILQAEDELAAVGMVIGAAWAGARAFTPTAGPGISLMNEFIGLAYYAEVPAVIFDVQRTGPSTGMPTRTQQGDLMLCAYASHGDTRHICLYPADPREAFEFAVEGVRPRGAVPDAGVRAERSRHRHERLDGPEAHLGRQLPPGSRQGAVGRRARPGEDVLPLSRRRTATASPIARCRASHPKGAYFTRGSGHNRFGGYTEDGDEYVEVVDRIDRKIQRAAAPCRRRSCRTSAGAKIGLVTVGGCHAACVEALDLLAAEGIAVDYMRVRGFPFGDEVRRVPRAARREFHRRAEPRCAAAQPADARDRRRRSRSWNRCATTAASR